MSEAKHTAAPWNVSTRMTASGGIEHAQGGFVAFTTIPRAVSDERVSGESWLDMRERTQSERDLVALEQEANARLIAAAPDLLDALQMAKHIVANEGTDEQMAQVFAAIEKATGEPA